jgi:hypothetical protein
MKNIQIPTKELDPDRDRLLTMASLGKRWDINPKVARKRLKRFNAPVVKFNPRTLSVRFSDVIRIEKDATVYA